MAIGTAMIYISLIVILAVCVGGILLQIFLSRRESWWPGLLLPLLAIYFARREKRKRRRELEKMKLQDLN